MAQPQRPGFLTQTALATPPITLCNRGRRRHRQGAHSGGGERHGVEGTGLPSYLYPQQKSTAWDAWRLSSVAGSGSDPDGCKLHALPGFPRPLEGLGHLLSPLPPRKCPTFSGAPGTTLAMGTAGKASLRGTGSLANASPELQGLPPSLLSPGRPCEGEGRGEGSRTALGEEQRTTVCPALEELLLLCLPAGTGDLQL